MEMVLLTMDISRDPTLLLQPSASQDEALPTNMPSILTVLAVVGRRSLFESSQSTLPPSRDEQGRSLLLMPYQARTVHQRTTALMQHSHLHESKTDASDSLRPIEPAEIFLLLMNSLHLCHCFANPKSRGLLEGLTGNDPLLAASALPETLRNWATAVNNTPRIVANMHQPLIDHLLQPSVDQQLASTALAYHPPQQRET